MSGPADPLLRYALEWMEKAGHDTLNARNTLSTMRENCPYDTVCFHAQQAVEKYIKAVLVYNKIDFSKTHDVGELAMQLPNGKRPTISKEERANLTDYAVAYRYPGVHEELTREDADEALCIAERVEKWAREQIPRKSGK